MIMNLILRRFYDYTSLPFYTIYQFLLFTLPYPYQVGCWQIDPTDNEEQNPKKKHKRPYYKYLYVIQFILAAFQIREMSMRLQNMEQTEIKGNFENFTYMS